jgi:PAS domain S-box-containing protein
VSQEGSRILEEMLNASPDALIVVGDGGLIESATAAAERLFGYKPDELLGTPVETLLPTRMRSGHVGHRAAYWEQPEVRPMGVGLDLRALRRDGTEFPVDVSLIPTVMEGRLRVGAYVRDATERRRGEDLLRFVNEVSHGVLAGGDTPAMLTLAASMARTLVGATVAWVAVRTPLDERVVVAAADGAGSDRLVGATVAARSSLAAHAMATRTTLSVANMSGDPAVLRQARDAGLGPGIYLPMLAEDGPVGTLVLARAPGAPIFTPNEVASAEVFASAAAIVLAMGRAREELESARISLEHERIARDLHDTVIQRLFALGMSLQGAERFAQGKVGDRIRESVDAIDEVIREIRETIFDLNRPDTDGPHLRQQVRQIAAEATDLLGFSPRIAFRGPVETVVDDEVAGHLLAVLREALTNAGRHANASHVEVVLAAADGDVTLSVTDDGIGMSDGPTAGEGRANMSSRAEQLGGTLTFSKRSPSGTLMQWRVPRRTGR